MSRDAINIAISSMTSSTLKQYECPLKKWHKFSLIKKIDPYKINIIEIQNFLTEEFTKGASYGTINSYRSALSCILGPEIAQDPGIKRICKGASKLRPSLPKYQSTWNPKIVLNFLAEWSPNQGISLEELSYKTATLLALVTAHRIQTLSLISLKNIIKREDRIEIKITEAIKTSKTGRNQPLLRLPFYENENICAARALEVYIDRTKDIRKNTDSLFLSFKKPFKKVGTQTLSKWIKRVLENSGIDTTIFSAYSTRHASTSAAKRAGVSIDTIRLTAGWTKDSTTFTKFYDLKIVEDQNAFARSILNL